MRTSPGIGIKNRKGAAETPGIRSRPVLGPEGMPRRMNCPVVGHTSTNRDLALLVLFGSDSGIERRSLLTLQHLAGVPRTSAHCPLLTLENAASSLVVRRPPQWFLNRLSGSPAMSWPRGRRSKDDRPSVVQMETGGVRRLNRSSPNRLSRPAQRMAFFYGLVRILGVGEQREATA